MVEVVAGVVVVEMEGMVIAVVAGNSCCYKISLHCNSIVSNVAQTCMLHSIFS